jgi:hypothetical protein
MQCDICVSSCVKCAVFFFILLTIIVHDEPKARKRMKKSSVKVQKKKLSSAVKLSVRCENTSSLFAKR